MCDNTVPIFRFTQRSYSMNNFINNIYTCDSKRLLPKIRSVRTSFVPMDFKTCKEIERIYQIKPFYQKYAVVYV